MPDVPEPVTEQRITVAVAARILGLQLHTVYALIDRGELLADVTVPSGPKRPSTPTASG